MTSKISIADLSQEVQNKLATERLQLHNTQRNDGYRITAYNADGTRYFNAERKQYAYSDEKGNYMPYGGGSRWVISYGVVQVRVRRACMGEKEYYLSLGKQYTSITNDSKVLYTIPKEVSTKKEALEVMRQISNHSLKGKFTL